MAEDLYETLGIHKDASANQIRDAYRRLSRKWHPDINPGNKEAEERFKKISSAYDVLGNEEKRKLYDEFGDQSFRPGFQPKQEREYRQWSEERPGRTAAEEEFGRFHSFEDLFGDFSGFGQEEQRYAETFPARDIESSITIDLISALKGMETEVSMQKARICPTCSGSGADPGVAPETCPICGGTGRTDLARGPMRFTRVCGRCRGAGVVKRPCPTCAGSGAVEGLERMRVKIPPGIREGFRLKLAGKGEPGGPGVKPGDLYLTVHVREHPLLKREGDDLSMEVPITVHEAMAGAGITVPTLEGDVRVKVPPKSQSGQRLKLKGKGAANPKTGARGDLFIRLAVKVPRTEDKEGLEAARQIDSLYTENVRSEIRL